MDKGIIIRKAEIGDIEQIKAILFSSLKEYEIAIPENYSVSDIDAINDEDNIERVFVIATGGDVVGFVVLKPISENTIELKRLYVTFAQRGRRLGKYLLNHVINFALENSYESIRVETSSNFKEAVSLYKKHGFTVLKDVEKAPGHDLAFEKNLKCSSFSKANSISSTSKGLH